MERTNGDKMNGESTIQTEIERLREQLNGRTSNRRSLFLRKKYLSNQKKGRILIIDVEESG